MEISKNNQNFGAKFFKNQDFQDIVIDSAKKDKIDKLNTAIKNIESNDLRTRLLVNLCYTDNYPTIIFSRYEPKKNVTIPKTADDYELTGIAEYTSDEKINILTFARRVIVKMGRDVPNNKTYRKVVREYDKNFIEPFFDVFG